MQSAELQKEYVIRNFYDLLQALREHPEWLQELRELILTTELLEFPRKFDEFVKEVRERFDRLEKETKERFDRLEGDLGEFKKETRERFERLEGDLGEFKRETRERLDRLEARSERAEKDIEWLKKEVKTLKIDVAKLKGDNFERKVREKAPAYFGKIFRRVKVIDIQEWAEKLDNAEESGLITSEEREKALNLDILLSVRKDGKPLLLAVEVSYTADEKDCIRAIERSEVFYKVYGVETIPVVAYVEAPENIEEKCKEVVLIKVSQD